MKRLKRMVALGLLMFSVFLAPITVYASTSGTNDDNQTWLAKQLETYGVPVAITTVISGWGVSGAIWLITKIFRKKDKEISSALKSLKLTADTLEAVIKKLNGVEAKLSITETKSAERANQLYTASILPLFEKTENLAQDLISITEGLKYGALKVLNLLTEPSEYEITAEEE